MQEFWVTLPANKYDVDLGWDCSVLTVPGAKLIEVRMSGVTLPTENLKCDQNRVRFLALPSNIADATAKIRFEKKLTTVDTAVVVALIAMAGTLGSALLAYFGVVHKATVTNQISPVSTTVPPTRTVPAPNDVPSQIQLTAASALQNGNPSTPSASKPDGPKKTSSPHPGEIANLLFKADYIGGPVCSVTTEGEFGLCSYESLEDCKRLEGLSGKMINSCIPTPPTIYCYGWLMDGLKSITTSCYISPSICEAERISHREMKGNNGVSKACRGFKTS